MTNDRCFNCAFYLSDLSCMAFEKIPEDILLLKNLHEEKVDGQDGDFVFTENNEDSINQFFKLKAMK